MYILTSFLAGLGLHCYVRAFSSCERELLSSTRAPRCNGLSYRGAWAQVMETPEANRTEVLSNGTSRGLSV